MSAGCGRTASACGEVFLQQLMDEEHFVPLHFERRQRDAGVQQVFGRRERVQREQPERVVPASRKPGAPATGGRSR
ncbi:hypothetical protein [Accumulibacter sp.]|uniref:hypothetical protein n=1 Tax=Accumulibacter sp. TaxID=2053492 RepID=UPI00258B180F|nr:hypothetical protein [Accumulibacter sp.]